MSPSPRRLALVAACLAAAYASPAPAGPAPPATPSASVTWGSDLTGDAVPIRGTWREDSEFWTQGVHAPTKGTITTFRLKVGDTPKPIPTRFSVVRSVGGGKVKVITTTTPPFTLKAHAGGVHTFRS